MSERDASAPLRAPRRPETYEQHWHDAAARRHRASLAEGWPFVLIGALFAILSGMAVHFMLVLAAGGAG